MTHMNTTLTLSAVLQFGQGGTRGGGTLNANPSVGTTSVTITGVSGAAPVVGIMAWFNQCDTNWTGTNGSPGNSNNSCTGSYSDNGGLFVCGGTTTCNSNGSGSGSGNGTNASQFQFVKVTSVTNNGGGSYTVGFTPGIYMPNWDSSCASTHSCASMYWTTTGTGYGISLEDMTVVLNSSSYLQGPAYASWIKGVRFVGAGNNRQLLWPNFGAHDLLFNNYFFTMTPSSPTSSTSAINAVAGSDDLYLNNIEEYAIMVEGAGAQTGDVYAYNLARNNNDSSPFGSAPYEHGSIYAGLNFVLSEGNLADGTIDDDTWTTGDLDTWFRNWYACSSIPFTYGSVAGIGIAVDAFHRFDNAVANVIGGTSQLWNLFRQLQRRYLSPEHSGHGFSGNVQFDALAELGQRERLRTKEFRRSSDQHVRQCFTV